MKNYLFADAGSTKTDWALVSSDFSLNLRWNSNGINPLLQSDKEIFSIINSINPRVPQNCRIDKIFFYGTGCLTSKESEVILSGLRKFWPSADIYIESDMVGAGRASIGNKKGVACILGTGSNSALFNNGNIIDKIPSLGFILGDEGSGAALGKRLLNSIFKKQLPATIIRSFFKDYPISLQEVIDKTYRQPSPSAFLASFSPFILENLNLPEIKNLIKTEFTEFFSKNIVPYNLSENHGIGFVGSIAFHFREILEEIAMDFGFKKINVIKSPLENIILYHLSPECVNN